MAMFDLTEYSNEERSELTAAPEDEYSIRISKFRTNEEGEVIQYFGKEKDKPGMMLFCEIMDDTTGQPHADYKEFTHFLWLPHDEQTAKQKRQTLFELDQFGKAIGINLFDNQVAIEDIEGVAMFRALLALKDDPQYGEQNSIKKFLLER